MKTRIAEEHRALDMLFAKTKTLLEEGRDDDAARDALEELREALSSHLVAEESLYFPTIWALRPEFEDRLRAFIRTHHHFRGLVEEISGLLESGETEEARHMLERLKHEFGRHEVGEEDALRSLDDLIRNEESA